MDRFASITLTFLICVVALGQFVQVITRYVLEIPVMGLEESLLYPTMWLYMLGAVNASRENTHIRANVLEIFLSTKRQHQGCRPRLHAKRSCCCCCLCGCGGGCGGGRRHNRVPGRAGISSAWLGSCLLLLDGVLCKT